MKLRPTETRDIKSIEHVDVRRADQRGRLTLTWLDAWHSFNFGTYQEPGNDHFGLLIVSNDDVVAPAKGFEPHGHRNLEIVTWLVEGAVEHRDSNGNHGTLHRGQIQRMTAGSGIVHSEFNPSQDMPARWIQMWLVPEELELTPAYEDVDIDGPLEGGELIPIFGSHADAIGPLRQRHACLWAGRIQPGSSTLLPDAPFVHVYVALGEVEIEGIGRLLKGEAARMTACGPRALRGVAAPSSEILVWEMHAQLVRGSREHGVQARA